MRRIFIVAVLMLSTLYFPEDAHPLSVSFSIPQRLCLCKELNHVEHGIVHGGREVSCGGISSLVVWPTERGG